MNSSSDWVRRGLRGIAPSGHLLCMKHICVMHISQAVRDPLVTAGCWRRGLQGLRVCSRPLALTVDQILALAPDPSAAAAGRSLAAPSKWRGLGQSDAALWGECQGSALYQVRIDRADLVAKCS